MSDKTLPNGNRIIDLGKLPTGGGTAPAQEQSRLLDPHRVSPRAVEFKNKMGTKIVGQDRAVRKMTEVYQTYLADMNNPTRPIGVLLFLGPTGTGKTRVVEAASEALFNDDQHAVVKIDCTEFQHSHEIAKLVGSPPGYLGHRETSPMLTQDNLDKAHTNDTKLTFVLFDEIEKASDSVWQLLLGILDKATLSLGDNRKVDFTRCVIVMTSNLGAREMSELITGTLGFAPAQTSSSNKESDLDQKIYKTARDAANKKFSPEFMNRIDKVIVFRSLNEQHIRAIMEIELRAVQNRITTQAGTKFVFECDRSAKDFLLYEGIEKKYGARHIKRSIERFLVYPISNLIATEQIEMGDYVIVSKDEGADGLSFRKSPNSLIISAIEEA